MFQAFNFLLLILTQSIPSAASSFPLIGKSHASCQPQAVPFSPKPSSRQHRCAGSSHTILTRLLD